MIEAMACGTPVAAYPVTGPNQVVEQGVTGYLDGNLYTAVSRCLKLDRDRVQQGSQKWNWQNAWEIFRDNLIACQLIIVKDYSLKLKHQLLNLIILIPLKQQSLYTQPLSNNK
jgi:glycosyltransferase involved in cell wall biosynthesis